MKKNLHICTFFVELYTSVLIVVVIMLLSILIFLIWHSFDISTPSSLSFLITLYIKWCFKSWDNMSKTYTKNNIFDIEIQENGMVPESLKTFQTQFMQSRHEWYIIQNMLHRILYYGLMQEHCKVIFFFVRK